MISNHAEVAMALQAKGLPTPMKILCWDTAECREWLCIWETADGKDLRAFFSMELQEFRLWLIETPSFALDTGTHTSITEVYAISLLG